MMVYLAEESKSRFRDLLGVYASMELAKARCQQEESRYFGEARTPPLNWRTDLGLAGYASATGGLPDYSFYQVTGMPVLEELEDD